MDAITAPSDSHAITLTLVNTPAGVLIRADGDLAGASGTASVARTLCRFAADMVESGELVRLAPEVVDQLL